MGKHLVNDQMIAPLSPWSFQIFSFSLQRQVEVYLVTPFISNRSILTFVKELPVTMLDGSIDCSLRKRK